MRTWTRAGTTSTAITSTNAAKPSAEVGCGQDARKLKHPNAWEERLEATSDGDFMQ